MYYDRNVLNIQYPYFFKYSFEIEESWEEFGVIPYPNYEVLNE